MPKRTANDSNVGPNPPKKVFSLFTSVPAKNPVAETVRPAETLDNEPDQRPADVRTAADPNVESAATDPPEEIVISEENHQGKQMYKGVILSIGAIIKWAGPDVLSQFQAPQGKRNRGFVKCNICAANENEARRHSSNKFVYMAQGIRYDTEKKLAGIVDHILSPMHKAAEEAKFHKHLWSLQSADHPWIQALKKHDLNVVESLIKMATDVYSDSKLLTPSAWSWPARSLAVLHAQSQVDQLKQHGLEFEFSPFSPTASDLHYRDPVVYREMLDVTSSYVTEQLINTLSGAVKFAAQIDGSVDLKQRDNKFVFLRFNKADEPLAIETKFASVASSELRGSEGLLDVLVSTFKSLGLSDDILNEKFVGVTTDGESANTGRHNGLWKRLEDKLDRPLMNFWCACHRSDLAMEDLESAVPELRTWKGNLVSLASHFRASGCRTKDLAAASTKVVSFPGYTEIRFAEHLVALSNAALSNLEGCHVHWQKVVADKSYEKREKNVATGFSKTWTTNGLQVYLTSLMSDVCSVFKSLEKALQRDDIVLPDILKFRDTAVQKLEAMLETPFPGGKEEAFKAAQDDVITTDEQSTSSRAAKVKQAYVSGFNRNRSHSAIRLEVIQGSINFISERLADDQQSLISAIVAICGASDAPEFIAASRPLLPSAGIGNNLVQQFADEVFDSFNDFSPTSVAQNDHTARIMHMLKHSKGLVRDMLSATIVVAPHSMTVERCVSAYNLLFTKLRCSTMQETLNQRLTIAWNGVPTAQFDARPCVANFLRLKDRRLSKPNPDVYATRDFVRKFFE